MCFLYMAEPAYAAEWRQMLSEVASELEFREWPHVGDPRDVRYILVWEPVPRVVEQFPNLQVMYCAGAGVDQFDLAELPQRVTLVRLVDTAMADIMAEYVVLAVLALHRNILSYQHHQREHRWAPLPIVPAWDRKVGVMGLGHLGQAAVERLRPLGFHVNAWNRSLKAVPGGRCYVGDAELPEFLAQCDILVNLLPLTPQTMGILNRDRLRCLPRAAGLVNVGRGGHVVEGDLLHALDTGQVDGAVLDVLEQEPPATDHPFWEHPRVLLTPHIASNVQVKGAVQVIASNLHREQQGLPLLNAVDRQRGY